MSTRIRNNVTPTDIERYNMGLNWRVTYLTLEKGTNKLIPYKVAYVDMYNVKALVSHRKAFGAIFQNVDQRQARVVLANFENAYDFSLISGKFRSFLYTSPDFHGPFKGWFNFDNSGISMRRINISNPDYRA